MAAEWISQPDGACVRELFSASDIALGEFRCEAGAPRWRSENCIGDGHHIAFPLPGTVVGIARAGFEPVLATANHAIFYDSNDCYRRRLVGAGGDHCLFLIVDPALLAEAAASFAASERSEFSFPFAHGPASAPAYLVQRVVAARGPAHDVLGVHDALLEVVGRVVADAYRVRGTRSARRARTSRSHAELVEEAKAVLIARPGATLEDVAAAVHTSPFHLARTFRARTGYSIRSYRNQIRVRSALEGILDRDRLADVAARAGFASHSHLTDSFRRTFGLPPSEIPAAPLGRLRELARAN